jgi:cation diffusion facilitator CzcD-associated flavoprotein CzcO
LTSMNKPNFTLTTQRVEALEGKQALLVRNRGDKASNTEPTTRIPADVIVLANGFEATRWLHPLKVYGRSGKLLQEVWDERGGPQAYMGTAMDGFPNFFLVGGPNTSVGHSSVILASESLIGYILRIVKPVLRAEARFVEPKMDAEIQWTREVQQRLKKTVFSGSCASWYKDEKGWNSTMYPYVCLCGCFMIDRVS